MPKTEDQIWFDFPEVQLLEIGYGILPSVSIVMLISVALGTSQHIEARFDLHTNTSKTVMRFCMNIKYNEPVKHF